MRESTGSRGSVLIYKASADNSINLYGSAGLAVQIKVFSRLQLAGQLDFFRSRARHLITFTQEAFPSSYEQDVKQQIASVNLKVGAFYALWSKQYICMYA